MAPDNRAAPSLRRALLAWLVLPLVVLVPLATAMLYGLAVRPAMDSLDRALTDTGVALARILETRDGRVALPLSEQTDRALRADLIDEVVFAVGDGQGGRLAGDPALLALGPALAPGDWRFFDGVLHRRAVRVAAHGAPCGEPVRACAILVAESLGKRSTAERAVLLAALGVTVLLAACFTLLALWAVRRGLRPLSLASGEIEQRSLQRLDPLDLHTLPREVAPFGAAINDLFGRLRVAAAAQRAFVDDAAHQLRTPLATLLAESAQALDQPHPPALHPALLRLHAAAERGARLVRQLLTLARSEGAALERQAQGASVDLAQLATEAAPDWLRPSLAAGQDLGFELQPAPVAGDALLLRELMGNLVHNAQQHAGPGARVTLRTRVEGTLVLLEVEDDGPGMAPEDMARAWDRFHRGRAAAGQGTGLGLAIVRDIARVHGAQATLHPGPQGRGLRVRVAFAQAEAQAVAWLS